jgi:pyridoxal phosphate enzyme (YggS family)
VLDAVALRARLTAIREKIAAAASRAGRDPSSVRLVAVSKTFPSDHIRVAYEAGQRDFGENKVQEATAKMAALQDLAIDWHLLGHLQSNKAKKAAEHFTVIHSVHDVGLLKKLDGAARESGRRPEAFIQVDLAGESTKFGAPRESVKSILDAAASCQALRVVGLMLLPPAVDDPEASRPHFAALRALRDELVASGAPSVMLSQLSMGMSHDFEVAIEEGATMVRVGSAIFGQRY